MFNKYIRTTFLVVNLLLFSQAFGQLNSLSPVLVGSAGGLAVGPAFSLSYSVGEPVTTTVTGGQLTLTQGFQQPVGGGNSVLSVSVLSTDLSCAGANDGTAKAIIHTGAAPYQFSWSTSPPQITEVAVGLKPGTYYVTTTDANQFSVTDSVVVKDNRSICGIHVYSGFSPNGDGKNDLWVIDYIDLFKPNTVLIYNRWGELVWDADNYDNTTVVWNGTDKKSGTKLPDGTYFYVIRIGAQEQRNWVEITR